jgi:hypothetical protein
LSPRNYDPKNDHSRANLCDAMNLSLAATWHPRGEIDRLIQHLKDLQQTYTQIIITVPPQQNLTHNEEAEVEELYRIQGILVSQPEDWSGGRYTALRTALETGSSHIQYADMDRLLRWMETRPDEWRQTVYKVTSADCLIVGRTPQAYQTHPEALVQTEAISNRVVSSILGIEVDCSAGSKGFSRKAAEFLVANTIPGRALGTDAEWPILLHKAGFRIDYIEVDGLDWESADRYKDRAANRYDQRQAALRYDNDPQNWAHRVEIAREIVFTALETASRQVVWRARD